MPVGARAHMRAHHEGEGGVRKRGEEGLRGGRKREAEGSQGGGRERRGEGGEPFRCAFVSQFVFLNAERAQSLPKTMQEASWASRDVTTSDARLHSASNGLLWMSNERCLTFVSSLFGFRMVCD